MMMKQTDKKRILLIDDDESFTRYLKLNLEGPWGSAQYGYHVRVETRGRRGLAAAREFRPDLILLDIVMPDMEGSEVAAQILADETVQHTPIVFLTAAVLKEEVEAQGGLIAGQPFLAKPVDAVAVIMCIKEQLGA